MGASCTAVQARLGPFEKLYEVLGERAPGCTLRYRRASACERASADPLEARLSSGSWPVLTATESSGFPEPLRGARSPPPTTSPGHPRGGRSILHRQAKLGGVLQIPHLGHC